MEVEVVEWTIEGEKVQSYSKYTKPNNIQWQEN